MSLSFDRNLLEQALSWPPLPGSVMELTRAAADPENGASDVAKVLNFDQAMLTKVLVEANSATQAAAHAVGTAQDAVMRLGVLRVVSLALSDAVSELLERPIPAYGLEYCELSLHSQLASVAAERLIPLTPGLLRGELVTASLLHDIGKLVVGQILSETELGALRAARNVGCQWHTAEQEILGVDHAEVGRIMLDAWGFPEDIGLAVHYHHSPSLGGGPMAHGIAIADAVAHGIRDRAGVDTVVDCTLALSSASELRLAPESIKNLFDDVERIWLERTGHKPESAGCDT
ncbi:MAG: HDOD domain-containing protein [Actinobacteria bacterium]|nr:HDOD domain-containing protein [Actinomycetota bacterium]